MRLSFLEQMETVVKPWLQNTVKEGDVLSYDGIRLHYYYAIHPEEKASIIFTHGFCEFFGKYHEMVYRFYQQGFSVFFLEYRGHGKSERILTFRDHRVIVSSFDEYKHDLEYFMEKAVRKLSVTKKYLLFAHSMGGAIASLYMEEHPDDFRCAVLSSPMLKMSFGKIPDPLINALGIYSRVASKDTEFAPQQHGFTGEYQYETSNYLDEERYQYQFEMRKNDPDYQTFGATVTWVAAAKQGSEKALKNATKIRTPILLCQAGLDTVVDNDGQNQFAEKSPYVSLVRYEDSKHEIYNAAEQTREQYYRDILKFFTVYSQ